MLHQSVPVKRQDIIQNIYGRVESERCWRGYVGKWHLNLTKPEHARTLRAMRMWKKPTEAERQQEVLGSGPAADLVQHNVYEEQFAFGGPTVRPNDGFWESSWRRFYDDDFYAPVMRSHSGAPGWASRKTVALDGMAYMAIPASLPTSLVSSDQQPASNPNIIQFPGVVSMELFLGDSQADRYRWSCVVSWDVTQGPLLGVAIVAEQFAELGNIEDKLSFDELPQLEVRDRLPEDPTLWFPGAAGSSNTLDSSRCSQVAIRANASSQLEYIEGAGSSGIDELIASAAKPAPGNKLLLLPDSMYVVVPEHMPASAAVWDAAATTAAAVDGPVVVEFGGKMRSGGVARMRVRYNADGSFNDAVVDRWHVASDVRK